MNTTEWATGRAPSPEDDDGFHDSGTGEDGRSADDEGYHGSGTEFEEGTGPSEDGWVGTGSAEYAWVCVG
ncbi:hypothetical protein [Allonocardiopsis opalescens]|nr:hypothetical protein [Allonocardiopsis opalescens]